MAVASVVNAGASVAVICTLAQVPFEPVPSTPILFRLAFFRPKSIQIFKVASTFIVVHVHRGEVIRVDLSDTECSWAELNSFDVCAASCGNVVEVVLTSFVMIDHEAVAMLPGVLHLVVTEPGFSVQ